MRPTYTLHLGDVRSQLRLLPAKSVQAICTSPPYWALRDYQNPPDVWGGDPKCAHEWGETQPAPNPSHNFGEENDVFNYGQGYGRAASRGQYCQQCSAWLGQLGLEPTPSQFIANMLEVFREVWRVLRPDGVCWVNIGDTYAQKGDRKNTAEEISANLERAVRNGYPTQAFSHVPGWDRAGGTAVEGLKPKDMCGIPWRLALALQASGWYLRSDSIWAKANPKPSPVRDRPTTSHEYVFMFTKKPSYFYDPEAVRVALTTIEKRTERRVYNGKSEATSTFMPPNPAGRNLWTGWLLDELQPALTSNLRAAIDARGGMSWLLGLISKEFLAEWERDQSLWSIWELACESFPEQHFATFCRALPRTCILAATSEKGCCPHCLAPWKRVIKRRRVGDQSRNAGNRTAMDPLQGNAWSPPRVEPPETLGWKQGCECPLAEPIPCTVLDPFNGSGTTGVVAAELGRSYVGIDVNEGYHQLALERLHAAYAGMSLREARAGQGSLFEEVAGG